MAKGKANPALTILVLQPMMERPEVQELIAAGHNVVAILDGDFVNADLIIHPAAHGWHDSMWESPYLKAALTAGRKRHRERKKSA